MGILNDKEIAELCRGNNPMLNPFIAQQEGHPSYGLGSFGYDLRLGRRFILHRPHTANIIDPRNIKKELFKTIEVSDVFLLQPHSQVLAESVERFNMPDDVIAEVIGKSTYARCGLLVNTTLIEAGWRGILTMELANLTDLPICLYVGYGIGQVIFHRGERPQITYAEKGGVYQNQKEATLPIGEWG